MTAGAKYSNPEAGLHHSSAVEKLKNQIYQFSSMCNAY